MRRPPALPRSPSRLATPILLILLPTAFFLALFHPATLDIGNPGWLIRGTDNGENALGAYAYWRDPTAGARPHTTLLNAPEGVPVLFTDSNPLLTMAAKPFAAWLPNNVQLIGPAVLLTLILQALFAWALLRHHAPGPLALWTGVILLAFPPTLANRFVHVNLMAHWTILAALWLFLHPVRRHRWRWWAGLIAVTTLIHSYLLVMVGAIWASGLLARFVAGPRRARIIVLVHGAAMLLLVAMLARWLGVGGQGVAGNFGAFSMPLDALWNPQLDHFSLFLPGHERSPGRGFEGFQYLGAGTLLLVALAIGVALRRPPRRRAAAAVAARLRALVPALVVLTMIAIWRGPLPDAVLALLDPVRASGRMFWPVGYVLVLMAVLTVYRLSAERAGLALLALVAVQVIDLSGMAHAIRAQSAEAERHRLFARTPDPRWDRLVAEARDVAFMPGNVTDDLDIFQEVAWRGVRAGRPVRNVYAARTSPATEARLASDWAAFRRGELVPGRLYVLLRGSQLPAAATPRLVTLDGVSVIAPLTPPATP